MTWFVVEAIRGLRARPGFVGLLIVITGALVGSSLWYANGERAAVHDEASQVRVDGWYLVTFSDLTGEPMSRVGLDTMCHLDAVAWAAGVLPAEDHVTPGLGRTVTLRGLRGCRLGRIGIPVDASTIYAPVGLIETFPLGTVPGTAAMSGFGSQGTVTVLQHAALPNHLLGSSSREGFLVLPDTGVASHDRDLLTIRVGVTTLDAAIALAGSGPAILRGSRSASVRVQPTRDQYEAQRTYLAGLDQRSAIAVVGIATTSALISAGLLIISTRLRAHDYARRRTLGCRRLPLAAQVMVEAMVPTMTGAALGTGAIVIAGYFGHPLSLPATLLIALPTVTVAATGLLSLPVAVWVGAKDPILVLRVP